MPFVDFVPPGDSWKQPCRSPEHEPPPMIVLRPGTHTWRCPSCGAERTINVREVTLRFSRPLPRSTWSGYPSLKKETTR